MLKEVNPERKINSLQETGDPKQEKGKENFVDGTECFRMKDNESSFGVRS